ncbi:leucine-rich repeat domain-containing protein [Metabacillus fastidiosus]|uniref:leucine-rich repeat domain-containing protein n=1 Tax=Metabacillus fastidiosus TaxID=1458 RepID=UPI003D2BF149
MSRKIMFLTIITVFFFSLFTPYLSEASAVENINLKQEEAVIIKDKQLQRAIAEELQLQRKEIYKSDIEKLKSLSVPFKGIKDLSGIEQAVNLEKLEIGGNNFSSLAPIKQLNKLEHLDILAYEGSDFENLKGLVNLKTLNVSATLFQDLNMLTEFTHLESLDIGFTSVKDLSPIKSLSKLKNLNISYLDLQTIEPIKYMPNLEKLEMYGELYLKLLNEVNEIKRDNLEIIYDEEIHVWVNTQKASENKIDVSWFYAGDQSVSYYVVALNGEKERIQSENREIKWKKEQLQPNTVYSLKIEAYDANDKLIGISKAEIKTLPQPAGEKIVFKDPNLAKAIQKHFGLDRDIVQSDMETITELELYRKRIKDLTGLESAVNLETLYISDNKIEKLDALSSLKNLHTLFLDGNPIKDYKALGNLDKLQSLSAANTGLTDLKALEPVKNVEMLSIDRNEITDFSPIASFSKLKMLSVIGNGLKSLKEIEKLKTIEFLSISDNPLLSLKGIENLPNLQVVDLNGTEITSIKELLSVEKLQYVSLWNTQKLDISENSEARKTILQLQENGIMVDYENNEEFYPQVGRTTENSAEIFWEYGGEKEISYVDILVNDQFAAKVEWSEQSYLLQGLNPGTEYNITVNAYDANNKLLFTGLTFAYTSDTPSGKEISFKDEKLRDQIKEQLGIERNLFESDMEQLYDLSLIDTDVKDLTGIENAKNLSYIAISGNSSELDLAPLKNLPNLTNISLNKTKVRDYTILNQFNKLNGLDISGNKLKDISFVGELPKLQSLNISYNEISDLSALSKLKDLSYVEMSNNKISNIAPLQNSKKSIGYLNLASNPIENIDIVSEMEEIFFLNLDHTAVTSVSPLINLGNLYYVSLYDTKKLDVSNGTENRKVLDELEYWDVQVNLEFAANPEITIEEATSSTLSVSWDPMVPEGEGTYNIVISSVESGEIVKEVTVDTKVTKYTFKGLKAKTRYNIEITGENGDHYGYAFKEAETLK